MRVSSLSLAVLVTSASAVPHRRHAHPHPVRRDAAVVTQYITATDLATLYVDQNGNPVTTSVEAEAAAPTSADPSVDAADYDPPAYSQPPAVTSSAPPAPSSPVGFSSAPSPAPVTSEAAPSSHDSAPASSSVEAPQASSSPEPEPVQNVTGYSIAYAGYNSDNSCKTKAQVDADIDNLSDKDYGMVRIYGTDCEQVPNIMDAAKRNGMKVFLGIYDVFNVASEAQLIIDGAQNDWTRVHTVSVGNEAMNNQEATASQVIEGINTARSLLQAAGYTGYVTTVDVYSALLQRQNEGICDAVDYIAANCHPYFNAAKSAEEAGEYVASQAQRLSDMCGDAKDVIITETGWPTAGQTNGRAVPGAENQAIALKSLRDAYIDNPNKLVLFSAYDDPWKKDNDGTFGTEKFWGIYGMAPSAR